VVHTTSTDEILSQTNAALGHFIAAMLLYPDVQAKAQAELDAIVGSDRLPDFSDRSNLPYVNSVILETLRWKVLLPMGKSDSWDHSPIMNIHAGLPHCTTADDVFDGYFIPRGSLLMANLWAIMHDPEVYEEPDDFRPERFLRTGAQGQLELNPEVLDPAATIFGYGRRCATFSHHTTVIF
jgi:cytochrome P450